MGYEDCHVLFQTNVRDKSGDATCTISRIQKTRALERTSLFEATDTRRGDLVPNSLVSPSVNSISDFGTVFGLGIAFFLSSCLSRIPDDGDRVARHHRFAHAHEVTGRSRKRRVRATSQEYSERARICVGGFPEFLRQCLCRVLVVKRGTVVTRG